ncbi:MAG: hypothetical protein WCU88_07500 [Elusimicrobiota bacterium]|jgi:uncharacterized membrane protein YjfL (UPF0719 family)
MNLLCLGASVIELALTAVLSVSVVYLTLRALIRTNTDFDEDKALLQGNLAVGILVAALLIGSAHIMYRAFEPAVDLLRGYITNAHARCFSVGRLILVTFGDLALAFLAVVASMSIALRIFGRLTRAHGLRAGQELEKGNAAVGILLAGVVAIVSLFMGGGVEALSKAVLPSAPVGSLRIMR